MDPDRKIGRVVKVRTYQALVELLPDTSSYVKSSYGGLYAIAVINSYVIIPIGSERVVALVTALDMAEEPVAQTLPFMCSLNETGQIRHDKAFKLID